MRRNHQVEGCYNFPSDEFWSHKAKKGIAAGEGTRPAVENGFASLYLLACYFRFTNQRWVWLNPSDNPHLGLTATGTGDHLSQKLVWYWVFQTFDSQEGWWRKESTWSLVDTKCHQILVWYWLSFSSVQHSIVWTVIIAFTAKVLLPWTGKYYIPREMSLSNHSVFEKPKGKAHWRFKLLR